MKQLYKWKNNIEREVKDLEIIARVEKDIITISGRYKGKWLDNYMISISDYVLYKQEFIKIENQIKSTDIPRIEKALLKK